MANLTIRNIDDDIHRTLKKRAESNGRSMEAEIRHILSDTARRTLRQPITPDQMRDRLKHIMDVAGGGIEDGELDIASRRVRRSNPISFD